jgi:hypothetical protein
MPDAHREERTTLRLPEADKTWLKDSLRDKGWTMHEFWLACLATYRKRPATFLAEIAKQRPAERRGRPKR